MATTVRNGVLLMQWCLFSAGVTAGPIPLQPPAEVPAPPWTNQAGVVEWRTGSSTGLEESVPGAASNLFLSGWSPNTVVPYHVATSSVLPQVELDRYLEELSTRDWLGVEAYLRDWKRNHAPRFPLGADED